MWVNLTELLTQYGEIAEVWLDGANGEGPNGKRQFYDWQRYLSQIRQLQPDAVIAASGSRMFAGSEMKPHTRRANEWSVVPLSYYWMPKRRPKKSRTKQTHSRILTTIQVWQKI